MSQQSAAVGGHSVVCAPCETGDGDRASCRRRVCPKGSTPFFIIGIGASSMGIRVRIGWTLGDIDPLNKVPFKRAISGFRRVPFKASPSYLLPRRV